MKVEGGRSVSSITHWVEPKHSVELARDDWLSAWLSSGSSLLACMRPENTELPGTADSALF